MSQHLFNDTDITAIANAIRTKKGTQNTMTVSQMPSEIASMSGTDYMEQRVQGTLTSYEIPNTCTKISEYAFSNQPMTSVTIPNTITEIGDRAFIRTELTSITIPNSVTKIAEYAISYCKITDLSLPGSLTSIGSSAFASNTLLTSVTFDSNLYASFGSYTFNSCNRLTTLNNFSINYFKPDSSSSNKPYVPSNCFYQTALVGDISLGNSAYLGGGAFNNSNSTGILYIHFTQADTSLLASSYTFNSSTSQYNRSFNPDHCRLVVPYSADHSILTAYQTQWPNYSTIMIEESQT